MALSEYIFIILGALVMLIFFMYMFWKETSRRVKELPAEIFTVVKCGDGKESRRKYQEGDYIGKTVADCPGGVVVGIFKESIQQ
ncbi:MAG: hypothetical protein QXK71_02315 [Pyrobaculum sp.]